MPGRVLATAGTFTNREHTKSFCRARSTRSWHGRRCTSNTSSNFFGNATEPEYCTRAAGNLVYKCGTWA